MVDIVMNGQGRSSGSWSPPIWKSNKVLTQDMTLNDEDASLSDIRHKQIEAASRLGGLMPDSSGAEVNGFRPRDCNVALLSVNLECISAEPPNYLKRRDEHSHGSGCEDSICSLFQNVNGWRGSSCTLLQSKGLQTCQVEFAGAGGSCAVPTSLGYDPSSTKVDLENGVSVGYAVKEKAFRESLQSLQNVTGRFPPIPEYYEENVFQEMGFPPALIQRAILLHGGQADDSIILQFLLDWRENNDILRANFQKQKDPCEVNLPIDNEIKTSEGNISGLSAMRQQLNRTGGEQLLDREDVTDSGFDDYDEASLPQQGLPTFWTDKKGSDYPVTLRGKKLLIEEGFHHLLSNYGFAAELVQTAIQELGEGADYDMLLEYLLYRTAQQNPHASTSAGYVKRANNAKRSMEEFSYEAKTVERAVVICEEDQMADHVDFLAAHGAALNKDKLQFSGWSWLRQRLEENESTSSRGKQKLGYGGSTRRKSIVRLSRPCTFQQEQYDHPALSLASNLKREKSNQSSLHRKQSSGGGVKVKLVPSQRRYTHVSRMDRTRMVKEEISITVDRHEGSVGFGLPGNPVQSRYLDDDVKGAPFFYFENVASMPNDEWDRIRRHLFDIEPEFVDSMHFSACRRPRGYIHNLPLQGRKKILADPPMTIQELLPHTKAFWPAWDPRTKLNCITTRMGSEFLIKKLHIGEGTALQTADPSPEKQREILNLCRHWNLVWTAPNIPTPIDEIEIEAMLGFDAGHSRNILSNRSRFKALGNSFSVYTVAFHFSVLKPLYPNGVKVLSLFSGLGGAEVALHKLGVKLLVVVIVEIDDGTRRCLEAWWASSKQAGVLNQNYRNIKDLGRAQISELVNMYGGFDLIVGGTPCNNLSGSNHVTRVGLDGKQSSIFFEFSRVVTAVRELTIRLRHK